MKKIAIIVQRYGDKVSGGGEYYAKTMAEHLSTLYNVDVITTTCLDYMEWDDYYSPGEEVINNVKVIRFRPLHQRDWKKFNEICIKQHDSIINNTETSFKDDLDWIDTEGPYCPDLIEYVKQNSIKYDAIFVITYIYYTAVRSIPYITEKLIFIPTAHDEVWIRQSIYRNIFELPRYFIYLTEEEKKFVNLYFKNEAIPSLVVGTGVDVPSNLDFQLVKDKYNINGKYIIFVGRVDVSKGCDQLIGYFLKYLEYTKNNIKLILVGKVSMEIPNNPNIITTGFISEEEKFTLIKNSVAMIASSKFESLCIALLETFAVGTPAIVNGECEILKAQCEKSNAGFSYKNYSEFEKAVNIFINDVQLRNQMGQNGFNYVRNNYGWDVVVKKFSEAIEYVSNKQKHSVSSEVKYIRNVYEDNQIDSNVIYPTKESIIKPFFEKDATTVCFSSSEYFAPVLSVALKSLLMNISSHRNYDIIVFITDMKFYSRKLLYSMISPYKNVSLRFVNVERIISEYKFKLASYYNAFTYYRLLIPLLMKQYKKVLYIDSDLVINHDISELFDINIDGYFIAAVRDLTVLCWQKMPKGNPMRDYFDSLGLTEVGYYMQGGVSLYNIKEFNDNLPTEILMQKAIERSYLTCDQDLININCKNKIKFLSNKWNVVNMHPLNEDIYYKYLPSKFYNEYTEARKDPYIIHFSGQQIPIYQADVDLYYYFWEYARQSPFYERILATYVNKQITDNINKKNITSSSIQHKSLKRQLFEEVFSDQTYLKSKLKYYLFKTYIKHGAFNYLNKMSVNGNGRKEDHIMIINHDAFAFGPHIRCDKGKHKLYIEFKNRKNIKAEVLITKDDGAYCIKSMKLFKVKNFIHFKCESISSRTEFVVVNKGSEELILNRICYC